MVFLNPMWDNEAERIGKQRCTRLGYALHLVSDLVGFAALLIFIGTVAFLVYRVFLGGFRPRLLWLLLVPCGLDLARKAFYAISWSLAVRKGFHYDQLAREASWLENGERHAYNLDTRPS